MPLACDPNQTFRVHLDSDADKPDESRPDFEFRFLTGREWKACVTVDDRIEGAENAVAILDDVLDLLRPLLVGWRNMTDRTGRPMPFDKAGLEDLVNPAEAWELLGKVMGHNRLDGDDLGKSASQPPTGSDGSASPAPGPEAPAGPTATDGPA